MISSRDATPSREAAGPRARRLPYPIPRALEGGKNLGFMFLPNYRGLLAHSADNLLSTLWVVGLLR